MAEFTEQDKNLVFALDIGTRSIVGMVGRPEKGRLKVLAVDSAEHEQRTMLDGQIDDIMGVATLARTVTERLEKKLEVHLNQVSVAAAGRALRTQRGSFSIELSDSPIGPAEISRLEAGAVSAAEDALQDDEQVRRQFYLVGYTVAQYRLDNYPLNTLLDHNGQVAEADIVATFLPREVVESLYAAMRAAELQVASITLEPIAAMNAAIPAEIRLLNLALVDIGAGTSDIAICRDGSVVGYTMVTQAGDEVTEAIMKAYLVDFKTAEQMKRSLETQEQGQITYTNILGLEESVSDTELLQVVDEPMRSLAEAISRQILEINGGPPSALFMAGGGSRLRGLLDKMVVCMGMDANRVALAGNNYSKTAFSDEVDINNPEYATPLGIAVSAGMGLLNDSYIVVLNGKPAKLFRNGAITLQDILLMNGYTYSEIVGRTGKNLKVTLDGRHMLFRGEPAAPAVLRVNGQDAALIQAVHAGDVIDFTPAKSGANAERRLCDLVGEDFCGRVLVNNVEAEMDMWLEQGDTILTLDGPAGDVDGEYEEDEEVPEPEPYVEQSEPVQAAQPEPKLQKPLGKPLTIALNQERITLPGKLDGEPYYIMDLLKYSGIDFQKLDRPVRMELNGEECTFQTVLRENDSVDIRLV